MGIVWWKGARAQPVRCAVEWAMVRQNPDIPLQMAIKNEEKWKPHYDREAVRLRLFWRRGAEAVAKPGSSASKSSTTLSTAGSLLLRDEGGSSCNDRVEPSMAPELFRMLKRAASEPRISAS